MHVAVLEFDKCKEFHSMDTNSGHEFQTTKKNPTQTQKAIWMKILQNANPVDLCATSQQNSDNGPIIIIFWPKFPF